MEAAAELTRRADFGLEHAQWLNLRGLDTISLLWEQAGSVAEWYALAQRYIHLENNALQYDLALEADEAVLIHGVLPVLRPRATQFTFAFVALTVRVFRSVLNAGWTPRRVEFVCEAPADLSAYRRFFRCDLLFGQPRNALVVNRADFERPLARRNPELVAFLSEHLRRQSSDHRGQIEERVAQMIFADLAGRAPSLARVAEQLAMSPRTLQRRLADRGTSYGAVLERLRREIAAERTAGARRIPLAQLAFELGFSDACAASRFLRSDPRSPARSTAGAITPSSR
jgi:AraC-like DNA-binding protein